jgi:hypothetical protein
MRISLPITNTFFNPVTATITKHNIDTQKERLNVHKFEKYMARAMWLRIALIAEKARNAMNASLTQKLKPQHQS